MSHNHKNPQDMLNRSMPIADDIKLGDMLQEMLDAYNDLATKHNSLLAKLDTDNTAQNAVVTASQLDVDYEATLAATSADLKDINQRG